jgi:DNA polymerase-3 subunit gamma/tau
MKFQISARKWRPQTFDEVVGQKHLVQILTHALAQEKIAQAYLFSGTRGVGKTTLARILAKALNCADAGKRPCNRCLSCQEITEDRSLDVLQIDGASNTSVEDVRQLRETLKYLPLHGKYKIYIIDEVHMLSNAAFNALLKTLEEPPAHLVFILATTESHKIPATVLSRCQQITFRRISRADMEAHLRKVLATEGGQISDSAMAMIVQAAEGSLRDGLSLLDQAIAYGGPNVTETEIATLFGRAAKTAFHKLVAQIHSKDTNGLLCLAREIENGGYDLRLFVSDWIEHLRHLIISKQMADATGLIDLPDEEIQEIKREATLFSDEALQQLFSLFIKLQDDMRNAPRPQLLLEVALVRTVLLSDLTPLAKLIEQLEQAGPAIILGNKPQTAPLPKASLPLPQPIRPMPFAPSVRSEGTPYRAPLPRPTMEPTSAPVIPRFPAVAVPSPGEGGDSVVSPQSQWANLLQEVKQSRPNLASYLDQGVVMDVQEKTIQVRFSEESSFLISLIQKEENQKWLQPLLRNHFKRDLKLICATAQVPLNSPPVQQGLRAEGSQSLPQDHPLVREVLNLFGEAVIKN